MKIYTKTNLHIATKFGPEIFKNESW